MSKDLPQQPQQSEEVDLGQLFKLIGNAFDRLFKFIESIFIGVYKVVLMFLIHFYKRIIWYVASVIVGLVAGFIIDEYSDSEYGANMFIETNFNSARQVYENLANFHQLASVDKDTTKLSELLKITTEEASKLKGFYIQPDLDENDIAEMYSDFYLRLDSLSRTEMTFEKYKESLTSYNFKIHLIGVASTDKNIYSKIEKTFVSELSKNPYLKELADVNQLNLEKKEEALFNQIQKNDSLVNEYLKIRINESQKEPIPGAGTNLYMGDAESSNLIVDESIVLEKTLVLETQRRQVNVDKIEQKEVINVLASFPESGYDISEWHDEMKLLLPLVLFLLTVLIFTILGLGKFLDNQSEE